MFSLASLYFLLRMLHKKKTLGSLWVNAPLAALTMALSMILKGNAMIFLLGEVCLLAASIIQNKREKTGLKLLTVALTLICYFACTMGLNRSLYSIVEQKPTGTPKIAWIAMGLQYGEMGNGWYNFFNRDVYWENDCDIETAKRLSGQALRESLDHFLHHPGEMLSFLGGKQVSQWTNPTFEALRLMQWSREKNPEKHFSYPKVVLNFMAYSETESLDARHVLINGYMKIYCLIVTTGALLYLLFHRLDTQNALLIIIFIGGFLFQLIWEASSRYVVPYFILLIPYSCMGIRSLSDKLVMRKISWRRIP